MDKREQKEINSRLGKVLVDEEKSVYFPRGLIGMERVKRFVLLQIRTDSPFYVLQNLENSRLGLLVADPFAFIQDYQIRLGKTEERVLQLARSSDLAIMVTVSIPTGSPEKAVLNLTGPVVINTAKRIGMQVPQNNSGEKTRIVLSDLEELQR